MTNRSNVLNFKNCINLLFIYYELILTHNLQMSDHQLTQTKERIVVLLAKINEKTDEVERLVKEEKCLIEEEKHIVKEDNTSMQDILAKIICAEENYKAAHMAYTKASETVEAAQKVYNDQRDAISVSITALQKTEIEDEIEANKAFYATEKEAIKIFTEWEQLHTKMEKEVNMEYDMQKKIFITDIFNNERNELNKKCYKDIIELLLIFHKTEADMRGEVRSWAPNKDSPRIAMEYLRININKIKSTFYAERQLSYSIIWDNFNKSEAKIPLTTSQTEEIKAKNLMADALQKYETEKLNFFKAYLIETLSDIEWKRSNFEMVKTMLKQITMLQACEEKRAEEKRITRAWTFGFICAVFGIALTWFRNKDFEYPLIDVTEPIGYLGMH